MQRVYTVIFTALAAACSARSDSPPPRGVEVAAEATDSGRVVTEWSLDRPRVSSGACEEDSVPLTVFIDSTATSPQVVVLAASLDTVAGYRVAVLGGQCGYAEAFVRQLAADAPEFLPLPPGFVEGLTTFDFDSTGRSIVFVEFDGQNGAFAVVRSVPEYRALARSARIEVPSGDAHCGFARFVSDHSWMAYVCTSDPNPQRYVRVRGRLGDSTIVVDTTIVGTAGLQ